MILEQLISLKTGVPSGNFIQIAESQGHTTSSPCTTVYL